VYGIEFGASALAAENFLRYLLCAPVPLFSTQLIDRIGFHWSVSIAAIISTVLVPIPWIIYKRGPNLRYRSRYVKKDTLLYMSHEAGGSSPHIVPNGKLPADNMGNSEIGVAAENSGA
jgi:hypothetical protein